MFGRATITLGIGPHSSFILAFASSNSYHTVEVADDWPTNHSHVNSVELLSYAIPIDSFDS